MTLISAPISCPSTIPSSQGVFTLLPLRVLAALVQLCRGLIQRRGPGGPRPSTSAASRRTAAAVRISADGGVGAAAAAAPPPPAHASAAGTRSTPSASTASTSSAASGSQQPQQSLPHTPHAPHAPHGSAPAPAPVARLSGSQLYDMLCLAILCGAAVVLRAVRPGAIYYWLKDITSEFLKMSVLSTAFDMSDKVRAEWGLGGGVGVGWGGWGGMGVGVGWGGVGVGGYVLEPKESQESRNCRLTQGVGGEGRRQEGQQARAGGCVLPPQVDGGWAWAGHQRHRASGVRACANVNAASLVPLSFRPLTAKPVSEPTSQPTYQPTNQPTFTNT